jgi:hypothetical protein
MIEGMAFEEDGEMKGENGPTDWTMQGTLRQPGERRILNSCFFVASRMCGGVMSIWEGDKVHVSARTRSRIEAEELEPLDYVKGTDLCNANDDRYGEGESDGKMLFRHS